MYGIKGEIYYAASKKYQSLLHVCELIKLRYTIRGYQRVDDIFFNDERHGCLSNVWKNTEYRRKNDGKIQLVDIVLRWILICLYFR